MRSASNARFEVTVSEATAISRSPDSILDPATDGEIDLTAYVSCYNEAPFVVQTLSDICEALRGSGLSYEILVIDDGSRDGSIELVRKFISEHPDERMILRCNLKNAGLAQNYIDGAFLGTGRYYKLFCGDNTEPVESIVQICKVIGTADMVIPSYLSVEGKNAFRQALSRTYTGLINLVSGNRLRYYNGLAVHRRKNVMRWHPNTKGFGFQADIICMLLDTGATYKEISVPAVNRTESRALTGKNILSVGHTLLDIAIRRVAKAVYGK